MTMKQWPIVAIIGRNSEEGQRQYDWQLEQAKKMMDGRFCWRCLCLICFELLRKFESYVPFVPHVTVPTAELQCQKKTICNYYD